MTALDVKGLTFNDPLWLIWIKAAMVLVFVLLWIITLIWVERRTLARMMNRIGPDYCGPLGVFQTWAEGIKLLVKEDFKPGHVDSWVFNLAPILTGISAFFAFAVIPFGGEVNMFGVQTRLQLADGPISVLFVLAIASVGIYGVVLAGWASSDNYSLLGGLRASAQTLSYEVAMGLSMIPAFIWSGSMSTAAVVEAQRETAVVFGFDTKVPGFYCLWLLPSFLIFLFAMLGEASRTPFDLLEAEQELVAGHMTEYSGFRFAMYYLGEYIHLAMAGALVTTMFLGGYLPPWPFNLIPGMETFLGGYFGFFWFFLKSMIVIFAFIWLRFSVPRVRYDQFMSIGWKWMIPAALVIVVLYSFLRVIQTKVLVPNIYVYSVFGGILAVMLVWMMIPEKKVPEKPTPATLAFNAFAAGYPVPPLPGQPGVAQNEIVAAESVVAASPALTTGAETAQPQSAETARSNQPTREG